MLQVCCRLWLWTWTLGPCIPRFLTGFVLRTRVRTNPQNWLDAVVFSFSDALSPWYPFRPLQQRLKSEILSGFTFRIEIQRTHRDGIGYKCGSHTEKLLSNGWEKSNPPTTLSLLCPRVFWIVAVLIADNVAFLDKQQTSANDYFTKRAPRWTFDNP